MTTQLLETKAGIALKEKKSREYTDTLLNTPFVLQQEIRTIRSREAQLADPINSMPARICGGQCAVRQFMKATNY